MADAAKYGVEWASSDPLQIELACVKLGGRWKTEGEEFGKGLEHHVKEAIKLLWPHFHWNRWTHLLLKSFCENKEIGVCGPGSSSKTYTTAAYALVMYYARPKGTGILMSTITKDGLQIRIWGAVKELNRKAKERHPWLPGNVVESRTMLTTDDADTVDGRDFRDGILGLAVRVGGAFVGLTNHVGFKNDVVILIADEASLMPRTFLDSLANLRKNPFFQAIFMGNPTDHNDCLGVVCEPHEDDGGWEGFESKEATRTWRTRRSGGIAIQLCGYDSPNYDYERGLNPFVGIITPEQIDADLSYYGKDSLQFSMMNLGMFPKDGGSRRVITRALCEKNQAFEEPFWASDNQKVVAGIDPAYSGTGGDRSPITILKFGQLVNGKTVIAYACPPIIVPTGEKRYETDGRMLTVEEVIAEHCKEAGAKYGFDATKLGLDSTGRGSVVSALAQRWSPNVITVEFGGKPEDRPMALEGDKRSEKEAYGKKVTALWFAARAAIESGQVRGLPLSVAEEGAMREWGVGRDGRVDVEPKEATKKRMGRSPDLFDSFVVALEVARKNGFQISNSATAVIRHKISPKLKTMHDNWKAVQKRSELTYA